MCWPSKGGGVRILGSEYEYFTGVFTSFIGPQVGCSISLTMSRAKTVRPPVSPHVPRRDSDAYRARGSKSPEYHSQPHTASHFHLAPATTLP